MTSHFLILVSYWVGDSAFVSLDRKTGATGFWGGEDYRRFELSLVDSDMWFSTQGSNWTSSESQSK